MIKVAPSLLSADFANLSAEILEVKTGGADYLHVDVMDGLFVPNITIGLPVVSALRKATDLTLDVHLMIDRPHRYVGEFAKAGADIIVFHVEADQPQDIFRALDDIKAEGKLSGLSIKPKTPASVLIPYIHLLDMVLIMTVEPGFGGQSFMAEQLEKLGEIRDMLKRCEELGEIRRVSEKCELSIDGGVDAETAKLAIAAGADVLVAGSAVFGKADRATAIRAIRGEG